MPPWVTSPTRALLAAVALAACNTTSTPSTDLCTVAASLDPAEGAPGAAVVLTADPLSTENDTVVRVGGIDAEILAFEREECLFCDACREEADECTGCEASCPDCVAACADCVQTVTFAVPEIAPGETEVVLVNLWGSTEPLPFTVLAADTGDTGYTGSRRRRRTGFRLPFTF